MSTKLKAKLDEVETGLARLRDQRAAKAAERDSAREAYANIEGLGTDSKEFLEAQNAVKELGVIDDEISDTTNAQVEILRMMGEDPSAIAHPVDRQPAGNPNDPRGDAWDSSKVMTTELQRRLNPLATSKGAIGNIDAGMVATRDAIRAEIGTASVAGLIQPDFRGLVAPIQRPLTMLDLVSTGTTDSNSIEYVQSTGISLGALEVEEGALKPELELVFTDADSPVRTIAGWVKIRKQTLADAAGLRSFIDAQLRYAVLRRLEAQVANGDGVGQNLRGIRRQTGIQPNVGLAGESIPDVLLKAATKVLLADLFATAHAVNPLTIQAVRLIRENTGAGPGTGAYLYGHPSQAGPTTMWGLPMVPVRAIPVANPLTGDFSQAQVLVREGVNVLFSDSDGDDFRRNRVTLLGEGRFANLVWRPDAFVDSTITPAV